VITNQIDYMPCARENFEAYSDFGMHI